MSIVGKKIGEHIKIAHHRIVHKSEEDLRNASQRKIVYQEDHLNNTDEDQHEFYTNEFINSLIEKLQTDIPVNSKFKTKNERRENRSLSNEIPFTNKVIQRNLETVNSTDSIETVYK